MNPTIHSDKSYLVLVYTHLEKPEYAYFDLIKVGLQLSDEDAAHFQTEIKCFGFMLNDGNLAPIMEFTDHKTTDIDRLRPEEIEYLKAWIIGEENPSLSARYDHILYTLVGTGSSRPWQRVMNEFALLERDFNSRSEALRKYIEKLEDVRDHANLTRITIEWWYDKCFILNFYGSWDFSNCSHSGEISPELKKSFERHLDFLDKTIKMFTECNDYESAGHNLLLKYNILHFLGDERLPQ